jgi:hypothetical protein
MVELETFVPVAGYAGKPLSEAFVDFQGSLAPLLAESPTTTFDATAFYSRQRQGLSDQELEELRKFDDSSYAAAVAAGGLIVYFRGSRREGMVPSDPSLGLNFAPDCMSFCVWESREQAQAGADSDEHAQAARRVGMWYASFALKKYTITTNPDVVIR